MTLLRSFAREMLPPFIARHLRNVLRQTSPDGPEWAYLPEGAAAWDRYPGWDHPSVAETQRAKWPAFRAALAEPRPLGMAPGGWTTEPRDIGVHNTLLSFGYVLARAARGRERLSMLDWGGGSGHYAALARALLPETAIDYTCRDLPLLSALGREMEPQGRFIDDDEVALSRRYDLVLASSSLHYRRDMHTLLARLCAASGEWLLITRLPVVENAADFAVLQRPWVHGYRTQYVCWFVNRGRLVEAVKNGGFHFVREFLVDERPFVPGAPEQCRYGGFLFQRRP